MKNLLILITIMVAGGCRDLNRPPEDLQIVPNLNQQLTHRMHNIYRNQIAILKLQSDLKALNNRTEKLEKKED